jgi:hypothetical protein
MKLKEKRNAVSLKEEIGEAVKVEMARFGKRPPGSSDPSPIAQAWEIRFLLDAGRSKKEIRQKFFPRGGRKGGKEATASNSWVNETVRFLQFPWAIQEKIHNNRLPKTAAYRLQEENQEKWQAIFDHAEAVRQGKGVRKKDIEDAANHFRYGAS